MIKILRQTGRFANYAAAHHFRTNAALHKMNVARTAAGSQFVTDLSNDDLSLIRDAVPHLDLVSIRALRRAGFDLIRAEPSAPVRTSWTTIPHPMRTKSLTELNLAE